MKTLYVGNLPLDFSEADIRALFSNHGTVHAATLILDRRTGRPRGIGFVDMEDRAAQQAIATLNHKLCGDRILLVNETHGRTWRRPSRSRSKHSRPAAD